MRTYTERTQTEIHYECDGCGRTNMTVILSIVGTSTQMDLCGRCRGGISVPGLEQ